MTKDGVMKALITISAAYPNFRPQDMTDTAKVWNELLLGYQDEEIAIALQAYILSDTSGFAPSIGQIIALVPRHNTGNGMSDLEAWGLVSRAVRNGTYGAEEEFARLPGDVRAAIGSPAQLREWASIDEGDLQTVAQSNFLRSYRAVKKREEMAGKLPPSIAGLFHREPPAIPQIETEDRQGHGDGIPMPEKYREKLGACLRRKEDEI